MEENELFVFLLTKDSTTSFSGFLDQRFNNLQRAALLTSLVQYDKILSRFGQQVWWIMRVILTYQKRGNILNE